MPTVRKQFTLVQQERQSNREYVFKNTIQELEKWLSGIKLLLLLQRTWVQSQHSHGGAQSFNYSSQSHTHWRLVSEWCSTISLCTHVTSAPLNTCFSTFTVCNYDVIPAEINNGSNTEPDLVPCASINCFM